MKNINRLIIILIIVGSACTSISYFKLYHYRPESIHTVMLYWPLQYIESGECIGGYVFNWTAPENILILGVDVWLGNPYDILWEGDAILTTKKIVNPWFPLIDEVIVHYQFDSHAPSSLTHYRSFDLRPGFRIEKNSMLYIYRLFNSFDEKPTYSGDGWMQLYYIYV